MQEPIAIHTKRPCNSCNEPEYKESQVTSLAQFSRIASSRVSPKFNHCNSSSRRQQKRASKKDAEAKENTEFHNKVILEEITPDVFGYFQIDM